MWAAVGRGEWADGQTCCLVCCIFLCIETCCIRPKLAVYLVLHTDKHCATALHSYPAIQLYSAKVYNAIVYCIHIHSYKAYRSAIAYTLYINAPERGGVPWSVPYTLYNTPLSVGLGVSITIIWDDLALSKSWSNIRYAILIHAHSLTSSLLVTSNNQQAPFTLR